MVATGGKLRYTTCTIIILVLQIWQQKCNSHDFRCPQQSEWSFIAKTKCGNEVEYFCLLDGNANNYIEFCRTNPDTTRDITWKKGQKCVYRGNLDGELCSSIRYQPFKFRTDGNSDCAYKKSFCQEEGMIIYNNGSTTLDTQCRCDHTQGFAFVSMTKQSCFCIPSQEDCSCYKKECKSNFKLSSDYNCIFLGSHEDNSACSSLDTRPTENIGSQNPALKQSNTDVFTENNITMVEKRDSLIKLTITAIVVFTIIIPVVCLKVMNSVVGNECTMKTKVKEVGDENKGNEDTTKSNVDEERNTIKDHEQENEKNEDNTKKPMTSLKNGMYHHCIQDWEIDDEKFIETKATLEIEKNLSDFHCVVVVGRSGNGKSSIIRHIALKLSNDSDYEIIPIVKRPFNILQFHSQRKNRVFIIDDFCGKEVINPHIVSIWSCKIDEILKSMNKHQPSVKLLFSVGRDIYDDNIFKPLESLKKYVVNLSDFTLTENEKMQMIHKYIPKEMEHTYKNTREFHTDYFPVLCKIAEGKSAQQLKNLFTNFDVFIKNDILALHKNHSLQFYFITYCALFNNRFKAKILDGVFSSDHEHKAFYEICMVFHYGLYKESAGKRLKGHIDSLKNGYVTQTEDFYHFVHRKVYQIAAIVCGQSFVNCYIKFASHSFIAERYRFKSTNPEETRNRNVIWINDNDTENIYFDRLMKDLEGGITYSSFHNSQLHYTLYRERFCDYCYERKQKVVALLYNLNDTNQSQLRKKCEENEQVFDDETLDYEDYINFEKQYHFLSHKMRLPILESAWEGYVDIVKLLIEMELDVNKTDRFGRSALIVASHRGKKEVVQILLENNADYSLLDNKKQSALLAASRKGHNEIVELLIDKNADASVPDSDGYTPFLAACEGDHKVVAEVLFKKGIDINVCDNMGQSSLYLASLHDCKNVVNYLISLNSDILLNKCDRKGMTPLSIACMKGNTELVNLLLEAKADVKTRDSDGRTPLFIACQEGHIEIVDILVKRGADIMTCDWQNHTLLTIACERDHSETADFLIKQNSSLIDKHSKDCRTPLFIACEKGHFNIVNILLKNKANIEKQDIEKRSPFYVACRFGNLDVAELLFNHGADISVCNKWGGSPLFTACREGHHDIAKFLIDNNSNFDADENMTTPLLVACEEGYTEIAKLLIAKDSGINTHNAEGRYPLHSAVFGGHTEIVKALIDKSAYTSLKDADGHTPLDIAKNKGFSDIENILRLGSKK